MTASSVSKLVIAGAMLSTAWPTFCGAGRFGAAVTLCVCFDLEFKKKNEILKSQRNINALQWILMSHYI